MSETSLQGNQSNKEEQPPSKIPDSVKVSKLVKILQVT